METVEEIQTKANRLESEYNKLKQDFKNYIETSQKNEQHKKQEMIVNQSKKLLVVADSLDRIAGLDKKSSCDTASDYSENLQRNVGAIYNQMLSASDLVAIYPAKGDGFDEQKHIAIGLEYGIAYPDNSIFRVIRKGYTLENNVVRPAEVIVMKTPADKKIVKPGLWSRFYRWIRSTKYHLSDINQKINELEQRQKDYLSKLEIDTQTLRDTINELDKKIERTEEVGAQQEEMNGKIAADMQTLRDTIHETEENETTPILHEEEADSSLDSYTDESNKNDENRNDSNRIGVNNAG